MEVAKQKAIIEAILFATGKEVEITTLMSALELSYKEVELILGQMRLEYQEENHGVEIIRVNNSYQMCTKKEYFDYIYPLFDNRAKPNLSSAAIETLSIIAYNPKITRAEIDSIRGVSTDGVLYKLQEYNLIEEAGKMDAPGRPTMYKVTNEFLKTFGYASLDDLPELPTIKEEVPEQLEIQEVTDGEKQEEIDNNNEGNKAIEKINEQEHKNEDLEQLDEEKAEREKTENEENTNKESEGDLKNE